MLSTSLCIDTPFDPLGSAVLKASAADFAVDELLPFAPDGEGEHVLVQIQRSDMTTAEVVRRLSKLTGVQRRNIAFSGTKDKVATVTQWFSIWSPGKTLDLSGLVDAKLTLLTQGLHHKKLRRGVHKLNHFRLVLRDVDAAIPAVDARLSDIREHGYANFFGLQRFGKGGSNLQRAEQCQHIDELGRQERSFVLSAIRAEIFNQVLRQRLADNASLALQQGDIAQFTDGGTWFSVPVIDDDIGEKQAQRRIVATGPLWGDGISPADGAIGRLENHIAKQYPHYLSLLAQAKMKADRRALKVYPQDLAWQWLGKHTLALRFSLVKSAYATSLVDNLFTMRASGE